MEVFYYKLSYKEFWFFCLIFSYQAFLISIVYLIYLLFQDVFFLSCFYEVLFQYSTVSLIFGECGTGGSDPQCLFVRYDYLKWLWMVRVCMEIRLLIGGFSVESCVKSVALVLYINVSKNDILRCDIFCSNLIVLCLLSKNTSSSC